MQIRSSWPPAVPNRFAARHPPRTAPALKRLTSYDHRRTQQRERGAARAQLEAQRGRPPHQRQPRRGHHPQRGGRQRASAQQVATAEDTGQRRACALAPESSWNGSARRRRTSLRVRSCGCYEAGPCGYTLQWQLARGRADCDVIVIVPALVPASQASGSRPADGSAAIRHERPDSPARSRPGEELDPTKAFRPAPSVGCEVAGRGHARTMPAVQSLARCHVSFRWPSC